MSTIQSVLKEECERLEKLLKRYESDWAKLPAGSISIKLRNKRRYAYRAYRDNDKIRTDYIGPVNSEKVKEMRLLIKKRRELEKHIRHTKERIRELRRVIK
jgi:hypothetical protein